MVKTFLALVMAAGTGQKRKACRRMSEQHGPQATP